MKRAILIACLLCGLARGQDAAPLFAVLAYGAPASTFSPLNLSPWAWYKADGNATDASGNGRNGTFSTPIYTNGVNSQAFRFNAAGYVGAVTNRMVGELTVCFWFRSRGDFTTSQYVISDSVANFDLSFGIDWGTTDNKFRWFNRSPVLATSGSISDLQWHHLAAVRSGSMGGWTITWYIDGVYDSTKESADAPSATVGQITIGRRGQMNSAYLKADIDDMMIFTNALTAPQVAQIYGWRQ